MRIQAEAVVRPRMGAVDVLSCVKPPISGSLSIIVETLPVGGPQNPLPNVWGLKLVPLQCYAAGTARRGKRASA